MAMTAFEVFGVLKLDSSQFNKGLDEAKSNASNVAGKLGDGLMTAAKVGVAAVGAATAAVTGFAKTSVDAATSFESAFTGVKKTVDATQGEYDQLESWIMDASTKMASSKEDIAATMEIAGQLGIRGVDGLEKFTETMIMLGDTTNLNSEEAASALAKFGNIAGLNATDMDRIGSAIVDLGNNFATTEADIVQMSTRLASAGTIAGFSATDILALSTAMSSVGINAEAGGTAMSTIMTKIGRAVDDGVDPSNEKLALFAQTAGMSAEEFAAAWKSSPTTALQGFVKGLDGMVDSGDNVTAVLDDLNIKGIRETNTIRSLALASDVLAGAVDTANTAFEENTALQHEAEMRYGTTESQMIQTKEAFKNLQVTVGKELMPTMSEFFSYSKTAIEDINKGLEQGGIEGMVSSIGTAISDALTQITEKLPQAIDLGIQLLSALGQGLVDNAPQIFDSLSQIGGILLNKLDDILSEFYLYLTEMDWSSISSAISQKIIDAFSDDDNGVGLGLGLFAKAEGIIVEFGRALGESASQLIPAAAQVLAQLAQYMSDDAYYIVGTAFEMIKNLADGIGEALPILLPAVTEMLFAFASEMLTSENIGILYDAAINLMLSLTDGLVKSIPIIAEKLPGILWQLLMGIVDNYPKVVEATAILWTSLGTALLNLGSKLMDKGKELGDSLFGGFIEKVKEAFTDIKNAVTDSEIYQSFAELLGSIKELLSVAWGFLTQWWSILWTFVQTEVGIMKAGLTAAFVWVKTSVETWLTAISLPFRIAFEGIKQAALLFWSLLKNAFVTSCNIISNVIKAFLALIKGDWSGALNHMKDAATAGLKGIHTVFHTVVNTIQNLIKNVIKTAKDWGKDLISSFVSGIKSKISSIGDAIREVAEKIWNLMHFSEPEEGPLKDFHTYAPDMMELFAQGIKDNTKLVTDQLEKSFDFSDVIADQNVSVSGSGGNSINGGVVINVYGAEGQNINELADEISYRLQHLYDVAGAVYA